MLPGWPLRAIRSTHSPVICLVATFARLYALIVAIATTSAASCGSVKWRAASSQTSSGTGSARSARRVAASVSASTARSASLKYGASRHAATKWMRSLLSPKCSSAREWMSTHPLQPLIWLARSSTIWSVVSGIPALVTEALSCWNASSAPGTIIAGFSILACMIRPSG